MRKTRIKVEMVVETDYPQEIVPRIEEFARNIDAHAIYIKTENHTIVISKQDHLLLTDLEES